MNRLGRLSIGCFALLWLTVSISHAALWDRGNDMIYCPHLDLTLRRTISVRQPTLELGDKVPWPNAMAIADNSMWGNYVDWRLPRLEEICWWNEEYERYENCTGDRDNTHCTPELMGGELGWIFYEELGNSPGGDIGSKNMGPFTITPYDSAHMIWFENNACVYNDNPENGAFVFFWSSGYQCVQPAVEAALGGWTSAWVWMVREGDSTPTPAPENTTASGTDVAVSLGNAEVRFSQVTNAGNTFLSYLAEGSLNPEGSEGALEVFSLVTDAEHSGLITVCYHYTPGDPPDESRLKLIQQTPAGWRNITTSLNTATDTICGETAGLGVFAVTSFYESKHQPHLLLLLLNDE